MNEDIKKALLKNRGGLEAATDSQLMIIWNSLSVETQVQYIKTVKKEKEDAGTIRGKSGL